MLRTDALPIGMAVIQVAFGVFGVLFFCLRPRKTDRALALAALFSFLYGARLFLSSSGTALRPTSRMLLALPESFQLHLVQGMTFLLPAAGFLFCAQLLGEMPRRKRWVWTLLVPLPIVIGVAGLFAILFFPQAVVRMMNVLGLFSAGVILVVAALLMRESFLRGRKPLPEMRVFILGFVVLSLTVAHGNLTFLGFPGPNLEAAGFFIFNCTLVYVVVARGIRNTEQLLAVRNELEIAREIQASILPQKVPQIAGTEIAACYVPMKAIGGDFYDFLPVDDKRLGVFIADVSGHGVPAALVASMVKVAVFAQMEHASQPAKLLFELNKILCGNLRGQFVTAAYLFLDAEHKTLSYAGAGHPPPLLWNAATQTARFLSDGGLMLGLFSEAEYQATELEWNQGDRCLLYTDGVIETENPGEVPFGIDRLEQLMKSEESGSPKIIADRLLDSVAAWRGRSHEDPQDDITIIALEFSAASAARLAV